MTPVSSCALANVAVTPIEAMVAGPIRAADGIEALYGPKPLPPIRHSAADRVRDGSAAMPALSTTVGVYSDGAVSARGRVVGNRPVRGQPSAAEASPDDDPVANIGSRSSLLDVA